MAKKRASSALATRVTAKIFVDDLASRLKNRVQITTGGHKAYLEAAEGAFGSAVDYGMLERVYAVPEDAEKCYSPPVPEPGRSGTGHPCRRIAVLGDAACPWP